MFSAFEGCKVGKELRPGIVSCEGDVFADSICGELPISD